MYSRNVAYPLCKPRLYNQYRYVNIISSVKVGVIPGISIFQALDDL